MQRPARPRLHPSPHRRFLLIPAIGAAVTVAPTVTGQQVASALIDHRGLFRLPRRALNIPRLTGLALLLVGSFAIQLT